MRTKRVPPSRTFLCHPMKLLKKTALAGILGLGLMQSSCIGPTNAFHNVLKWNQEFSQEKWVNELVFLGLNIVPVYPLAYLGDIVIFNSIEFWGGENPVPRNQ